MKRPSKPITISPELAALCHGNDQAQTNGQGISRRAEYAAFSGDEGYGETAAGAEKKKSANT